MTTVANKCDGCGQDKPVSLREFAADRDDILVLASWLGDITSD